jgi:hypothetical protein
MSSACVTSTPFLDVAEEATRARERLAVEGVVQALDLLMVGRDAAAQQPPRRGEPLEEVDLRVAAARSRPAAAKAPAGPVPTMATSRPRRAFGASRSGSSETFDTPAGSNSCAASSVATL